MSLNTNTFHVEVQWYGFENVWMESRWNFILMSR